VENRVQRVLARGALSLGWPKLARLSLVLRMIRSTRPLMHRPCREQAAVANRPVRTATQSGYLAACRLCWTPVDVTAEGRTLVSCHFGRIDLTFARNLELDGRTVKTISVKSTGHFRSGFEPIAGSIYNVDTAGQLSQDFANLPYTRLGRPVYPLDVEAPLGW